MDVLKEAFRAETSARRENPAIVSISPDTMKGALQATLVWSVIALATAWSHSDQDGAPSIAPVDWARLEKVSKPVYFVHSRKCAGTSVLGWAGEYQAEMYLRLENKTHNVQKRELMRCGLPEGKVDTCYNSKGAPYHLGAHLSRNVLGEYMQDRQLFIKHFHSKNCIFAGLEAPLEQGMCLESDFPLDFRLLFVVRDPFERLFSEMVMVANVGWNVKWRSRHERAARDLFISMNHFWSKSSTDSLNQRLRDCHRLYNDFKGKYEDLHLSGGFRVTVVCNMFAAAWYYGYYQRLLGLPSEPLAGGEKKRIIQQGDLHKCLDRFVLALDVIQFPHQSFDYLNHFFFKSKKNITRIPHLMSAGAGHARARLLDPEGYSRYQQLFPLEFEVVKYVHDRFYSEQALRELSRRA